MSVAITVQQSTEETKEKTDNLIYVGVKEQR